MRHLASQTTKSQLSVFNKKQIQPNAIDLKVETILRIKKDTHFILDENRKTHRGTELVPVDSEGYYVLDPGSYEILMEGEITIGPDEAGWVITRSTLNRNGVFITSGLYDSGYKGVMAGALHVTCGPAMIKKGTRVGQFLLFKAEALNQYDGDYGTGKADDLLYNLTPEQLVDSSGAPIDVQQELDFKIEPGPRIDGLFKRF